uniref:Nucleosome assembly protein 1-like 4 n=1 Tax=Sciurus vulgaris TaxID=55149 RepID=A0A8D2ABH5_SCIVU
MAATAAEGNKSIQIADNVFSDGVPADSGEAAKNAGHTGHLAAGETQPEGSPAEKFTGQVMQNPQVLAALQEQLDNISHTSSTYIDSLPRAVKRRINALKQLQVACVHREAKFYEEVRHLERKYAVLYQPLENAEDKLTGDMKNKVTIAEKAAEEPNSRGIPEFWFTISRNVDMLSELVQEYDEPILKHQQDIKVKFSDPGQPVSFVLEFHFEPNPVLTKTYKMKSEPDKANPFSFKGPKIVDCNGCTTDGKKGRNVTVKTIRKEQKHKGQCTVRTITKQVPNESFFNRSNPLKASGDEEALDRAQVHVSLDSEIVHFFHEQIVPWAVLYFTGRMDDTDFRRTKNSHICIPTSVRKLK